MWVRGNMRILFFDTETSPIIAAVFGLYDQNIPYRHVIQEWFILCAAWKWLGEDNIKTVSVLDAPKRFKADPTDDYHVIKTLHALIEDADALVAHNLNKFDWKKFMARVVFHGLPPVKKPVMIDTLTQSRQLGFSSRKLDDLGTHLNLGNKLQNEPGLWVKAAQGCRDSIKKLVVYCAGDIPPLENLYIRLRPYMPGGFNMGHYSNAPCCPACGSTDYNKKGLRHTNAGVYHRYRCNETACRKWFTSKKSIRTLEMRAT